MLLSNQQHCGRLVETIKSQWSINVKVEYNFFSSSRCCSALWAHLQNHYFRGNLGHFCQKLIDPNWWIPSVDWGGRELEINVISNSTHCPQSVLTYRSLVCGVKIFPRHSVNVLQFVTTPVPWLVSQQTLRFLYLITNLQIGWNYLLKSAQETATVCWLLFTIYKQYPHLKVSDD